MTGISPPSEDRSRSRTSGESSFSDPELFQPSGRALVPAATTMLRFTGSSPAQQRDTGYSSSSAASPPQRGPELSATQATFLAGAAVTHAHHASNVALGAATAAHQAAERVVCSFSGPSLRTFPDAIRSRTLPLRSRANDRVFAVKSSGSLRKRGRLLLFGALMRSRTFPRFCCGILPLVAKRRSFAPFRDPHTGPFRTRSDPGPPLRTRANDRVFAVDSSDSLRNRGRLLLFGTLTPDLSGCDPISDPPASNQSKRPRFCCGILRFVAKTRSFAPFRDPHSRPFRTRFRN